MNSQVSFYEPTDNKVCISKWNNIFDWRKLSLEIRNKIIVIKLVHLISLIHARVILINSIHILTFYYLLVIIVNWWFRYSGVGDLRQTSWLSYFLSDLPTIIFVKRIMILIKLPILLFLLPSEFKKCSSWSEKYQFWLKITITYNRLFNSLLDLSDCRIKLFNIQAFICIKQHYFSFFLQNLAPVARYLKNYLSTMC